jgi:hypothetical protein
MNVLVREMLGINKCLVYEPYAGGSDPLLISIERNFDATHPVCWEDPKGGIHIEIPHLICGFVFHVHSILRVFQTVLTPSSHLVIFPR